MIQMIIFKVLVFILFLGTLIFFHELGHFIFARLFGVRVEVFSLGFGPKLLKYKKRRTEYALSLIPLGGYIKMFGDDPLDKDSIPEDQRKYSFNYKSKWARFWIIFGGPLANFILAYIIFFSLVLVGETVPENRFGYIPENKVFYSYGIRSGDVLKKINGQVVQSPTDMMVEGRDRIETITVSRLGELTTLKIGVDQDDFLKEFGEYVPMLREPVVVNQNGEIFALSFDDNKVNWKVSLETILQTRNKSRISFYPVGKDGEGDKERIIGPVKFSKNFQWSGIRSFFDKFARMGYRTLDMRVREVEPNSPADKANIKKGDVIVSLNEEPIYNFEYLRKVLQESSRESKKSGDGAVKIIVWSNGQIKSVNIVPELKKESFIIGIYSHGAYVRPNLVKVKPKGFLTAVGQGFRKTWGSIAMIAIGFKKLASREVSLDNLRGPFSIAQFASDSLKISLSYFFQLMALISVNLGFINLLPVPILDGGHLMFIAIETVNRGPVSRRKLEIAQQFGLSILILLMVFAIYNDVIHFF